MSGVKRLLMGDMTKKGKQSGGEAYKKEMYAKLSPENMMSYSCDDESTESAEHEKAEHSPYGFNERE